MLFSNGFFASESAAAGHPDKVCDLISDTILDAFLKRDPHARVACEALATCGKIIVAGEFRTSDPVIFEEIRQATPNLVRMALRDIGYGSAEYDIDPDTCEIEVRFNHQAAAIAAAVDQANSIIGAGDQGLMFGYATRETETLFPFPLYYAHRIVHALSEARKCGDLPFLRPDAKSQVSVVYHNGQPVSIDSVVVSTQHAPDVAVETVREAVIESILRKLLPEDMVGSTRFLINPQGSFTVGGPQGDTGLTGRKIIADTYGGACPHGGGAFSGKDATKVDRSASYLARYLAKHVVAASLAERCTIQLAYAIGKAEPVSFNVALHGTGRVSTEAIVHGIKQTFDLAPAGIIKELDLTRPIFSKTAAYGHFGREDSEFSWEQTPRIEQLKDACTK